MLEGPFDVVFLSPSCDSLSMQVYTPHYTVEIIDSGSIKKCILEQGGGEAETAAGRAFCELCHLLASWHPVTSCSNSVSRL